MGLSVEIIHELLPDEPAQELHIDLIQNIAIIPKDSPEECPLSIEEWPLFSFLQGLGVERIILRHPRLESLESWNHRISEYQQEFLEDPDHFSLSDRHWNESELESSISCIELVFGERRRHTNETHHDNKPPNRRRQTPIPLMQAQLAIDAESLKKFRSEIERQDAQDVLVRTYTILQEFHRGCGTAINSDLWSSLVSDILCIALEHGLLARALQLKEEHRESLGNLWADSPRVTRILAAYEPKPSDLISWASLFDTCPSQTLVEKLSSDLAGKAGPTLVKLLTYRTQTRPEEMINICLELKDESLQGMLLQWLAAQWRPHHFVQLEVRVKKILSQPSHFSQEVAHLWTLALLRSDTARAIPTLKLLYRGRRSLFLRKTPSKQTQSVILLALSEFPTSETLTLLKNLRLSTRLDLRRHLEHMIEHGPWRGDRT